LGRVIKKDAPAVVSPKRSRTEAYLLTGLGKKPFSIRDYGRGGLAEKKERRYKDAA